MVYVAIGIIGATVMPHVLYLHPALVQSRKFQKDDESIRTAIRFNTIDVSRQPVGGLPDQRRHSGAGRDCLLRQDQCHGRRRTGGPVQ